MKYISLILVIFHFQTALAFADAVQDKKNELDSVRKNLSEKYATQIRLQKEKQDALTLSQQIADFERAHRRIISQFELQLKQMALSAKVLKNDVEEDQKRINDLTIWTENFLSDVIAAKGNIDTLSGLLDEYRDKQNTENHCTNFRASDSAGQSYSSTMNKLWALHEEYVLLSQTLKLPRYLDKVSQTAKNNSKVLQERIQRLQSETSFFKSFQSSPAICHTFNRLDALVNTSISLSTLNKNLSELERLDIDFIISEIKNQEAAQEFILKTKRTLIGIETHLNEALTSLDIKEAKRIDDSVRITASMLAAKTSQLNDLDQSVKNELTETIWSTTARIKQNYKAKTSNIVDLRSWISIRGRAFTARLKQKNVEMQAHESEDVREAWKELLVATLPQLGIDLTRVYRTPQFSSTGEAIAYAVKLQESELLFISFSR